MKWNEVTRIDVTGNILVLKDAMILLDPSRAEPEWPHVTCTPGEYVVEIHVPDPWTCHRVRVRRADADATLGAEVGKVAIDHGFAGIVDYRAFVGAVSKDPESYEEWTGTELDDELDINFSGEIVFAGEKLVYVKAGEGDGEYPVYALEQDGHAVGLECVFLA